MQDVNKIIDNLNGEWASDMLNMKKRFAILLEENNRLKTENKKLKEEKESEKE